MDFLKRAFSMMGRWTGLSRRTPSVDPMIEVAETLTGQMGEEPLCEQNEEMCSTELLDLSVLDGPSAFNEKSDELAPAGEMQAAIATDVLPPEGRCEPIESEPVGFIAEAFGAPSLAGPLASRVEEAEKRNEAIPAPELKPEKPAKPSVSFTQLYELIATEVNKRTDNAVNVYERLLAATREELESTRKNNRIAWSVGGVMTAVAAFGAIWAAGEVAATRVEVSGLKSQVSTGQQVSAERDQLRFELMKVKDQTAKVEIDKLKTRLDEALAVSDKLSKELSEATHEIKLARAATTQPISRANAASTESANGSERPDVWSVLLNGER